jgi:uncharacterized protein YndB with AHSA1/START domain
MTTATMQVVAEPGTALIVAEREVNAPRDLVYRAWTDPALLAQWLGPRRMRMVVERYDLRHGGTWRYVHVDTDGTEYGFHGVFHGDPSPERMVQTFEFEGAPGHVELDTVELIERGSRTLIRMTSAFQSTAARDATLDSGMAGGLEEGFQRLDELLARGIE